MKTNFCRHCMKAAHEHWKSNYRDKVLKDIEVKAYLRGDNTMGTEVVRIWAEREKDGMVYGYVMEDSPYSKKGEYLAFPKSYVIQHISEEETTPYGPCTHKDMPDELTLDMIMNALKQKE